MGKPVVAVQTQAMALFDEHVLLAETADGFIYQVERALANLTPSTSAERIAFAHEHSWENATALMLSAIQDTAAMTILFINRFCMTIDAYLKDRPGLKRWVLWLLMPAGQARPRWWVHYLINPWAHQRHRGSVVCSSARMDVLPFRPFALGNGSTVEDYAVINNGVGAVSIGHDTRVGISSVIIGPVQVGNHVIIAQHVIMSGLNHSYEDVTQPIHKQPVSTRPIIVEDECWIGANVVITAGVRNR